MVLVEDPARFDGIDPVGSDHRPRHIEERVDVGSQYLVLRRCRAHPGQAIDLPHRGGGSRFRQLGLLNPLPQLGQLIAITIAKLLLDRLELLAQVILPLRIGHLLLRLRLDLTFQLEQ